MDAEVNGPVEAVAVFHAYFHGHSQLIALAGGLAYHFVGALVILEVISGKLGDMDQALHCVGQLYIEPIAGDA